MRTVVVTGAAGALGQLVVARLAALPQTHHVVAVDRVATAVATPRVEAHVLDLAAPERAGDLAALSREADSVIHLAWAESDGPSHHDVNQAVLSQVLDAASIAGVTQLVHLSSATVYGAWSDNPIPLGEDASLRPNAELAYAVEKAEAERRVAEWKRERPDTRVVVLRPAVTVGSVERPLYQALAGTRRPASGAQSRPVQYLHLDDLAGAVVHAWGEHLSGVYNVAPDHGISEGTARELAGGMARVALPRRLANAVSRWSWRLWRLGAPPEAQAYAEHPWVVAGDRLRQTGWEPQYTSEEALVAADGRAHWEDMPASRRQWLTLTIAASAAATAAAGSVLVVTALRRRRGRPGSAK